MISNSSLISMIVVTCVFVGCTEVEQSPPSTSQLSFAGPDRPTGFWGDDPRDRAAPYVLWLKVESQETCFLPIYRTGYPTPPEHIDELAGKNGVDEVEIGVCPNMPNRCYLSSAKWLGSGLEEYGILKTEACDSALTVDPE